MLKQIVELCTSDTSLFWLIVGSDLAIALSYFAIPVTMAVVLRHRKDDIPYPWLWISSSRSSSHAVSPTWCI